MHIVKLDYTNGLHKEYAFDQGELATTAFETCCTAQEKKARARIYDEAGRQAAIDGAALVSVELVDVAAETVSAIRLVAEVSAIQQQFGVPQRPHRGAPPPQQEPEQEWRPAIGARPSFAA